MTPFEKLIQFLLTLTFSPWIFLKLLFLIGLLVYLAFAIIVVRQVNLMIRTLNTGFEISLRLISWVHLIVAIGVFLLALVIL